MEKTACSAIHVVNPISGKYDHLFQSLQELESLVRERQGESAVQALFGLVPEYVSQELKQAS